METDAAGKWRTSICWPRRWAWTWGMPQRRSSTRSASASGFLTASNWQREAGPSPFYYWWNRTPNDGGNLP